jgi:hypothetical protein
VHFADADALTEMLANPLVADLELARGLWDAPVRTPALSW